MTAPTQPGEPVDPVLQRLAYEITSYEATLDDLPVAPVVSPDGSGGIFRDSTSARPSRSTS